MTIVEANKVLIRHRNIAFTQYANALLAGGADADGEEFRMKLLSYARDLEKWRCDAMARLRRVVRAQAETPSPTLN
jgi:hypothetical protein